MDLELIGDGEDVYVVIDGLKVAKRGRPGTPQARTWISLEPGWRVEGTKRLKVSYDPPEAQ